MKHSSRILFLAAASILAAAAQDDPPGRVGRLSYMNGDVSYRPGDVEDWVQADYNRPLTTGDHLWTDDGARAELHVGSAALRLNSHTAFEFLNLDDSNVQIRLAEGSLSIHVRALGDQDTFEVDTPNLAFSLLRPGDYRIEVNPDSQTTIVTVRTGEGEVTGGGQAFAVHPREEADVSGGDSISYNVRAAARPDDWDGWCLARDTREDQSVSARYVSRDMTGYQDLDNNGSWRQVADYGSVWVPTSVADGWAPYHNGHWVWVEPWGWTWVDDAPWGFAPFHYGRWVYVGYWAWVPGPVAARPVYAPALVAWVGGANFGAAVSFGGGAGVAWFPLGPREVYVPAYNASPTYINRINVTNTTIVNNVNITNVYVNKTYINRGAPGAVTAVPQNAFASARPVQSVAVRVDARAVQQAQIVNNARVAPSRQSVLGNSGPPRGTVRQPPAAVLNRPVVAKATPPPPAVPFAQRQQALTTNPGRPLDPSAMQRLRTAQPVQPRPMIRQAQVPSSPVRPGGQVAPPARPVGGSQSQPPVRDNTPPPQRDDRLRTAPPAQIQAPPQSNVPPSRVQRDVPPAQPNNAPVPRPADRPVDTPRPQTRDAQPPPSRPAETPRPQPRDVQPTTRPTDTPRPADTSRPQPRDAQPRDAQAPPPRPAGTPRPQQRDAQPPPRPAERPAPKDAPKSDKKDKKDKDEKKQ